VSQGTAPRRLERLLVALPSTRMGGTERHTMDLARRLAARGGMAVEVAAETALHPALAPLLGPGVVLRAAAIGWETDPPETRAARPASAAGTAAGRCPRLHVCHRAVCAADGRNHSQAA
jgi:hypothetical protein